MARTFHSRRTLSALSEINLTNMIDLGFTLLIIFMISTPLIQRESGIGVQVPIASAAPQTDPRDQFLDVIVDAQGRIQTEGRVVTQAQLAEILEREARRPRPRVINLRADFRLQYQEVITVLDVVKGAGLSRISMETRPGS